MFEFILKDSLIENFYLNFNPLIFRFNFVFLIIIPQYFKIFLIFCFLKFIFSHETIKKSILYKNYIFNILIR